MRYGGESFNKNLMAVCADGVAAGGFFREKSSHVGSRSGIQAGVGVDGSVIQCNDGEHPERVAVTMPRYRRYDFTVTLLMLALRKVSVYGYVYESVLKKNKPSLGIPSQ